ncbi:unnamed protein product [Musa textilis]
MTHKTIRNISMVHGRSLRTYQNNKQVTEVQMSYLIIHFRIIQSTHISTNNALDIISKTQKVQWDLKLYLPRLGESYTYFWMKPEGAGRALQALSIYPLSFLAKVQIILLPFLAKVQIIPLPFLAKVQTIP